MFLNKYNRNTVTAKISHYIQQKHLKNLKWVYIKKLITEDG